MRLYIDSAQILVVESLMKTGLFYGVTTNPLILREAGLSMSGLSDFAHRVLDLGGREVFFQSWGEDGATLYRHGQQLARFDSDVVVKLPATRDGLEAASRLAGEGARVCVTAVFAPFQAALAASAGAAYVAPYLGRMTDAGRDGHDMISQMAESLRNTKSLTEILAASVRTPEDVVRLARNGVRCVTLSPPVAERLFQEPLTLEAARAFEAAARKMDT